VTSFYLYLDESGSFKDGEISAIGGLWAPDEIRIEDALESLELVYGYPMPPEGYHATDYPGDRAELTLKAISDWTARGWKGVLFEHVSQRTIIDNATTYVNVFADGLARFARKASAGQASSIDMEILVAFRSLPRDDDDRIIDRTPKEEYQSRLKERLALEILRDPLAGAGSWKTRLQFASAKREPRLMLADLLCNSWWRARKTLTAMEAVSSFIGNHHHRTLRADDAERIRLCLDEGDHVQALIELGDHLIHASRKQPTWLKTASEDVLEQLVALPSSNRHAALRVALARLQHLVDKRRDLKQAALAIENWRANLLSPLGARLAGDDREALLSIELEALQLALATANHLGALERARAFSEDLDRLIPDLRLQFEHIPLILEGRILQAVQRINAFDFKGAHDGLRQIDGRLEALLGLSDELISMPGREIRSDLRGRILGTALQAACKAARRDPRMLDEARNLSDKALEQFEQPSDRQRQAGYRFEIELEAGDLAAALVWLARSMALPDEADLETLTRHCAAHTHVPSQPFWLYHLAALWSLASTGLDPDLDRRIANAWKDAGLDEVPVFQNRSQHPVQVLLWKLGLARAHARPALGLPRLVEAIEGCDSAGTPTLRMIGLAIRADRLALLARDGDENAYRNAVKEFDRERTKLGREHGELASNLESWATDHPPCHDERSVEHWRRLARDVPY
jgi:hypothetical protein